MADNGLVLDIDLEGAEEAQANIVGFPADLGLALTVAMNKSLALTEGQVVVRTPVNFGHLRSGINRQFVSPFPNLVGSVGSPSPYVRHIEFGWTVGKMPRIDALQLWAVRKLGVSREESESVAWAIAKNIKRRGYKDRPEGWGMFKKGFEASEPHVIQLFNDAVTRATARAND